MGMANCSNAKKKIHEIHVRLGNFTKTEGNSIDAIVLEYWSIDSLSLYG